MKKFILLVALALTISAPVLAHATIFDPPPSLKGQKSVRLFTVPGVVTAGGLATIFSCTNLSQAPAVVGIQLYREDDPEACNDADAGSVTLAAGATVSIATNNSPDSSFFSSVPLTTPPMYMPVGSASILSTNKSVFCEAKLVDIANSPPLSMAALKTIRKKQVGD